MPSLCKLARILPSSGKRFRCGILEWVSVESDKDDQYLGWKTSPMKKG